MMLSFVALSSLVGFATAHATFQELWVNGVDQGGYCVRLPQSNSPVTDVTSTVTFPLPHAVADRVSLRVKDLTCNVSPSAAYGKCSVNRKNAASFQFTLLQFAF
jgi:cellulase